MLPFVLPSFSFYTYPWLYQMYTTSRHLTYTNSYNRGKVVYLALCNSMRLLYSWQDVSWCTQQRWHWELHFVRLYSSLKAWCIATNYEILSYLQGVPIRHTAETHSCDFALPPCDRYVTLCQYVRTWTWYRGSAGGARNRRQAIPIILSAVTSSIRPSHDQPKVRCFMRISLTLVRTTTTMGTSACQTIDFLSFYILNATSLAKCDAFQQLTEVIIAASADVIFITETWFNAQQISDLFSIPGYIGTRKESPKCKGGVCAFVKDEYRTK